MKNLWEEFKENELMEMKNISSKDYEEAREMFPSDEFSQKYGEDRSQLNFQFYYKKVYKNVSPEEMGNYLAYETMKSQRKSEIYLKTIKNIMVFGLVVSIICFIVAFITLT